MSDHGEAFLTLLGVNRECAVREPESVRQIDDIDDIDHPTYHIDEAERERGCHVNKGVSQRFPSKFPTRPRTRQHEEAAREP